MSTVRRSILYGLVMVLVTLGIAMMGFPSPVAADDDRSKSDRPPRALAVYPEYPSVVIEAGEDLRMDILVVNGGRADEDVFLEITEAPEGWDTKIKTYDFAIKGVHVVNGETEKVSFRADPDDTVKPGDYRFHIKAWSRDEALRSETDVLVSVLVKEVEKKKEDIILSTSYPVLRGPTDATFEFSVEVNNKMDKEAVFNLMAKGPKDWEVNFKPAYESKYISSIQIKENQTKNVSVEVKPYIRSQAGEYPIEVVVGAGDRKVGARLMVVLTGIYDLDVGTPTGLLSVNAQRGESTNFSIFVKNSGSAANHNISFQSFKPENWEVKFSPERIDAIEPGDLEQVEVSITPAQQALVGDYAVGINVQGEKKSEDIELRISVKSSPIWAWVGIIVILFVIAGLCLLFIFLGRR